VKEIEVRILNRWEDMPIVTSMLSRFAGENGLPPPVLHDLNVVLDEALNNIIAHGYEDGADGEIMVRLECRDGEIAMVIEDRGRPFDPRQVSAPDLTAPLHARKVGGLGVHFMRSLMDDLTYTRAGDTNRLCLIKKFTT
jgi:serine/threonine-protein kinase RsbW